MKVKDIIIAYCAEHYPEANGLVYEKYECGCSFDDFQPCESYCGNCVPTKWDEYALGFVEVERSEKEPQ